MVRFSSLFGVTLAVVAVLATPALAAPAPDYDPLGHETFNDVNAAGDEVAYTASDAREFDVSFDTTGYGIQQGESVAGPASPNRCSRTGDPTPHYSGRSGWVRFNPGVGGKIEVRAHTPTYDSIVYIAQSNGDTKVKWTAGALVNDTMGDVGLTQCGDETVGGGDEAATWVGALPNHIYYIHVGGLCPGDYTTCADPSVPGGETSLRLTFIPDDQDGDGVPDTKERQDTPERKGCKNVGTRGSVTTDGCPDTDHDSIADDTEDKGCVGEQGVAAASPYNGCAPGPAPPKRDDGATVTILDKNSLNARRTDHPAVLLRLNWRKGATTAFINNGEDEPADTVVDLNTLGPDGFYPWTLAEATSTEARQVKVTFRGPNIETQVSDIITLDPVPPAVKNYLLTQLPDHTWYLAVLASDDAGGTGIVDVQVLDKKGAELKPVKPETTCKTIETVCPRTTRQALEFTKQPRTVVVHDLATNGRSRSVTASGKCRPDETKVVPKGVGQYLNTYTCAKRGHKCPKPPPSKWDWKRSRLKCENGTVKSLSRRTANAAL